LVLAKPLRSPSEGFCGGVFRAVGRPAARQHEQAVVAEKDAFIAELKELIKISSRCLWLYRRELFSRSDG
jgi:hypothetical protein